MTNAFKTLFPVNLQYFSDADPEPSDPPAEPPQEPAKTFTQEELDKVVADRIARERKKYDKFADYDDIKKKAEEYEKLAEEKRLADMSAQQRAEEAAIKAQEERDQLHAELERERAQIRREKIETEFIRLATSANVAYTDDALRLVDLSAVEIGEDGKPVGVDAIVAKLVQDKPFLLGQKPQPRTVGGPSNPAPENTHKTSEQLLREAADKARKSGRMEDRVAYAQLKSELGL
ncbi:DUF4355 domain-containing protein [Brevibacillus brevis]|uniref:phage scaffolding protein n=1 Tax=Brevibacillus brevis TaxID=1393 RepID=UPI00165D3DF9|nr:DUF4355 domain-containing protein [Brevibacillus brevis]